MRASNDAGGARQEMTTVLSRGARVRRGGRRPGWMLLTASLVLAIAASSVLVFTSRVELLKLAVIVALWAAVVAAFVSVIYRRQSDADSARARDLKLVYDLQLDREISARREYELTVESQLRRELGSELRAQSADEVAALRTELAALRTNLEILFDADLSHRQALEPERTTVRAYSDWARSGGDSMTDTRIVEHPADIVSRTAENPIIDVPEVRIPTGPPPPPPPPTPPPRRHRRAADSDTWSQQPPRQTPQPAAPPRPQSPPRPPAGADRWPPPAPWHRPEPVAPVDNWQPVVAEGAWLPPGAPGSNWAADQPVRPPEPEPPAEPERPSRHGRPAESPEFNGASHADADGGGRRRAQARHSSESDAPPVFSMPPARHAGPDATGAAGAGADPASGGQSVADLLARLQPAPAGGGRRRRREE